MTRLIKLSTPIAFTAARRTHCGPALLGLLFAGNLVRRLDGDLAPILVHSRALDWSGITWCLKSICQRAALCYSFVMTSAFLSGFLLGASLIIAIGAQNAFILRQGLLRQHVFVLCLICALSDALLIIVGVAGLGSFISGNPALVLWVTGGGVVFLFAYALKAFARAFQTNTVRVEGEGSSLGSAIAACLAFTFLNPHVYLDTVVLLGSLSAQFDGNGRIAYGAGAALSSFVWFFSLGYGARLLLPVFQKPRAWQVLDVLIGLMMSALALSLLWSLL
jgi:L-lysine exporter family protein LysE/ArgO